MLRSRLCARLQVIWRNCLESCLNVSVIWLRSVPGAKLRAVGEVGELTDPYSEELVHTQEELERQTALSIA